MSQDAKSVVPQLIQSGLVSSEPIRLGISTCPNDTFAFHALMNGLVELQGLRFQVELLDVQQLNNRLLAGDFDVAKASFHAALMITKETIVLPSGSALGFGNGPLLLSRHANRLPSDFDSESPPLVLCPGQTTTATMLYRLFYPQPCDMKQVVFSEIMPGLQNGDADFGVCIHEGRFTWQQQGLNRVADLGETWARETSQPLPLGGILARRSLGQSVIGRVQRVIRDSIQFGLANRQATLPTMRRYAAEFADDVLMSHVDLYVNDHTVDLGETGRQALQCLSQMAGRLSSRVFPDLAMGNPIQVFDEGS